MTVAAANPITSIVATGGQTVFPFTWRADNDADVLTYINDVLQGGGAVVARNADQIASPGGTVTLAAQTVGTVVNIERSSGTAQATAVTAYGPFPGSLVERTLDRVVMVAQELLASFSRTVKGPRSLLSKMSTFDLPAPVNGKVLGFVDAGGGLSKLDALAGPGSLYPRDMAYLVRDGSTADGGQNLPASTFTKLTFARHKEVGTAVTSNNTDRLTIATPGTYKIHGDVTGQLNGAIGWNGNVTLWLRKNGVQIEFLGNPAGPAAAGGYTSVAGEVLLDLVATDYLELFAQINAYTGGPVAHYAGHFIVERVA
jgi:hypothetical protein